MIEGEWDYSKKEDTAIGIAITINGDMVAVVDGDDDEAEAIARLIAAAPDLLAACKVMVSYIESNDWEAEFADPMPSIIAAIAKAQPE